MAGALAAPAQAAPWSPRWLPATEISVAGRSSIAPSVAVGAGGDGEAVFLASREGTQRVEAAEMRTGAHWREPVAVSPPGCSASLAKVAMNAGGDAVATWACKTAAGTAVEVASKRLRGAWSAPVAISAPGSAIGSIDAAVGPGGEALVAWTSLAPGSESVLELASGAVAGSWGEPVVLGEGKDARVGVGAAGAAAVVWTGPGGTVEASTRPLLGGWGKAVTLAPTGTSGPARLGVDEAGRALAVWQRLGVIQASSFAPGGSWSAVEDASRASEGTATEPALSISPGGVAAAAWRLSDSKGNPLGVQVVRGASTGLVGSGSFLAAPFADAPAIAVDDLGHGTVAWLRDAGEFAMAVQGSTTASGSNPEWRKPLSISSEANLSPADLATDGDGNTTVLWAKRYGGGSYKVQSAYYQRAAPPVAQLTATEPPSPANDNSPRIQGSVPAGGSVSIYDNSTCSAPALASGSVEELETTGIQIHVENNTTTQLYAAASSESGAGCFGQVSYSERSGPLTLPEALTRLTTLDPFLTPVAPLTAGPNWGPLLSSEAGAVSELGWGPVQQYPIRAGAYWRRSAFVDSGTGVAVAARLLASPGTAKSRFFSLLLDLRSPAQEGGAVPSGGYELRVASSGTPNSYDVSVRRWPSGGILSSLNGLALPLGSYVALADRGGILSVWVDTGLGYSQLLSVADATFSEGFAGIQASGDGTRLRRFKAGALPVVSP